MKKIIKLIRPHQWLKNTFVFFPMFFGGSLMCTEDIMAAVITFFANNLEVEDGILYLPLYMSMFII